MFLTSSTFEVYLAIVGCPLLWYLRILFVRTYNCAANVKDIALYQSPRGKASLSHVRYDVWVADPDSAQTLISSQKRMTVLLWTAGNKMPCWVSGTFHVNWALSQLCSDGLFTSDFSQGFKLNNDSGFPWGTSRLHDYSQFAQLCHCTSGKF